MKEMITILKQYQDEKYAEFSAHLTPTLKRSYFIGVRVPTLRKLSKEIPEELIEPFLNELPHECYEENLLHGFIVQRIKDYDTCLKRIEAFLPYINCWAVSDTILPKVFSKHKDEIIGKVKEWINSPMPYVIRFGIVVLMGLYLDNDFKEEYLFYPIDIHSDEYYVNMIIAWYYATALAKQWSPTIKVLEDHKLDSWVHNKAIQKAIESYRISEEQKEYLRSLKVK